MTVESRDVNHWLAGRLNGFEYLGNGFRRNSADCRQIKIPTAEAARGTAFQQDESWNIMFIQPPARGRGRKFWLIRDDDNSWTFHSRDSKIVSGARVSALRRWRLWSQNLGEILRCEVGWLLRPPPTSARSRRDFLA